MDFLYVSGNHNHTVRERAIYAVQLYIYTGLSPTDLYESNGFPRPLPSAFLVQLLIAPARGYGSSAYQIRYQIAELYTFHIIFSEFVVPAEHADCHS